MSFNAKDFAGTHCGCRYQQDYRPTLGRDGKKESGTLEVIKFYYPGSWPTILPRISAGATPSGKSCWES